MDKMRLKQPPSFQITFEMYFFFPRDLAECRCPEEKNDKPGSSLSFHVTFEGEKTCIEKVEIVRE